MLAIRLLGRPQIEVDGKQVQGPRGQKSWALLGYLMLSDRSRSRSHLAELLFADAADPLGALRWALGELRRVIGQRDVLLGDPVEIGLDVEAIVDIRQMRVGLVSPAGLGQHTDLLEGIRVSGSPQFDAWLTAERHQVSELIELSLLDEARSLLMAGRPVDAIPLVKHAIEKNPLAEGNHELLIRVLAASGDRRGALRQAKDSARMLRAELDMDPSPALREAADVATDQRASWPNLGRAAVAEQIDAGRAAVSAGAIPTGIQRLQQAVVECSRYGDKALHAQALVALGTALINVARGQGHEGARALREGLALASSAGDRTTAAAAHQSLAYLAVREGSADVAESWLSRAQILTESSQECAGVLGVRGMNASDRGNYSAALGFLEESVEQAAAAGDQRQQAWSLSFVGRVHLLRGDVSAAAETLESAMRFAMAEHWISFLPWLQSLSADADIRSGALGSAGERLERALVLSHQLGDRCAEGMAARGIGLLHASRGESEAAKRWLMEAVSKCGRSKDRYQWVYGHIVDSLIDVCVVRGDHAEARPLVHVLSDLSGACDLRELYVRARIHQWRLGDSDSLRDAQVLASDIDNPALGDLIRGSVSATHYGAGLAVGGVA